MISNAKWLRRASTDLRGFMVSEDGLVTVEWVALAGAIVIGAIAIGWMVMHSLTSPAAQIGTAVGKAGTSVSSMP
jgi:Flp pilus assembly pilin Flp